MIQPSMVIEQIGAELKLLHLSANATEAEAVFDAVRRDKSKQTIALYQNGSYRTEANPAQEIAQAARDAEDKRKREEREALKAEAQAKAAVESAQKSLADAQAKLSAFTVSTSPEQSVDESEKPAKQRAKK